MNITIDRNGKKFGPYTLEEIKEHLANGTFNESDWAWHEGCTDWIPLKNIITPLPPSPERSKVAPLSPLPNLDKPTPESSTFVLTPSMVSTAGRRYYAAYIIARTIIFVGQLVQVLGVILGIAVMIGGILEVNYAVEQGIIPKGNEWLGYSGMVVWCLLAIAIDYILGLIIQALGQILMAQLDIAVHTSPFLSNEKKASVMRIK